MSRKTMRVEIPDDCFICGASLVVLTTAVQRWPSRYGFLAYDGDRVTCEDCGALGWVSCDAERAYVTWDELSGHNVACAEKYERSE